MVLPDRGVKQTSGKSSNEDTSCGQKSRIPRQRDDAVLQRLGKRPQLKVGCKRFIESRSVNVNLTVLQRSFGFMSIVGFSTTLMATWEPLAT